MNENVKVNDKYEIALSELVSHASKRYIEESKVIYANRPDVVIDPLSVDNFARMFDSLLRYYTDTFPVKISRVGAPIHSSVNIRGSQFLFSVDDKGFDTGIRTYPSYMMVPGDRHFNYPPENSKMFKQVETMDAIIKDSAEKANIIINENISDLQPEPEPEPDVIYVYLDDIVERVNNALSVDDFVKPPNNILYNMTSVVNNAIYLNTWLRAYYKLLPVTSKYIFTSVGFTFTGTKESFFEYINKYYFSLYSTKEK